MNEIKFEPVGKVYKTRRQKKMEQRIKQLEHWLIVFAAADAIYTALTIMHFLRIVMQ